jgi:hypothetical protein
MIGARMETMHLQEAQKKKETAAKSALDQLQLAEEKAGRAKGTLADVARNYMALAKKFPDTKAGQDAKKDAERIAASLNGK